MHALYIHIISTYHSLYNIMLSTIGGLASKARGTSNKHTSDQTHNQHIRRMSDVPRPPAIIIVVLHSNNKTSSL